MIAPPCDRNSLEADALEATGRERYIKSLGLLIVHLMLTDVVEKFSTTSLTCAIFFTAETKLKNLEGSNRKADSKQLVAALSEAREDHLRTFVSGEGGVSSDPWTPSEIASHEVGEGQSSCCCFLSLNRIRHRRGRPLPSSDLQEHACLIECDELEQFLAEEDEDFEDSGVEGLHNK